MMRLLSLILVFSFFGTQAQAADAGPSTEAFALKSAMDYCFTPLMKDQSVVSVAEQKKLVPITTEALKAFNNPDAEIGYTIQLDNITLITTSKQPICSVAIKEMDKDRFVTELKKTFGDSAHFQIASHKADKGVDTYVLTTSDNPSMQIMVSARDTAIKGGLQGLVSMAAVK